MSGRCVPADFIQTNTKRCNWIGKKSKLLGIYIVKFNNNEGKSISVCKYHDLQLHKRCAYKSVGLHRPQDWVEVSSQPNGGQGPILKDAGWISYVIWTSRSKESPCSWSQLIIETGYLSCSLSLHWLSISEIVKEEKIECFKS